MQELKTRNQNLFNRKTNLELDMHEDIGSFGGNAACLAANGFSFSPLGDTAASVVPRWRHHHFTIVQPEMLKCECLPRVLATFHRLQSSWWMAAESRSARQYRLIATANDTLHKPVVPPSFVRPNQQPFLSRASQLFKAVVPHLRPWYHDVIHTWYQRPTTMVGHPTNSCTVWHGHSTFAALTNTPNVLDFFHTSPSSAALSATVFHHHATSRKIHYPSYLLIFTSWW